MATSLRPRLLAAALLAPLLTLGHAEHAHARGPCLRQPGVVSHGSAHRVTLASRLRLSRSCEYAASPQGPWQQGLPTEGDFAELALRLQAAPAAADGSATDRGRPSSIYARQRGARRSATGTPLESAFLAGCSEYLMHPGYGFEMRVPVETQQPTVTRTAVRSACGARDLTLHFVPGSEGGAALRAGPWTQSLPPGKATITLPTGAWAVYAARGDAGLLVGRLQSGRSESPLRRALARADAGRDADAWFRPSWARGQLELLPASEALARKPMWSELRTAAAADALWFASDASPDAPNGKVLGPARIAEGGHALSLPGAPMRARMRKRYGRMGQHMVPTLRDWAGGHAGVRLCLAARYDAPATAPQPGMAVPASAACAPLMQLTLPLQERTATGPRAARICIKRRQHLLTHAGAQAGVALGEECIALPDGAAGAPPPFPVATVGDAILYSGASSAGLSLCTDNHCAPMPAAGNWETLGRPGLVEIRHAPSPEQAQAPGGLTLMRMGVIDPASEWHPVGLYGAPPVSAATATAAAGTQGVGGATGVTGVTGASPAPTGTATNRWTLLDYDEHDVFAFVRRRQRLDLQLSASNAFAAAWNAEGRGSLVTRQLPVVRPVTGHFPADTPSAFVTLVTREPLCPGGPAGALSPDALLDPQDALVDERFYAHLAHYRGEALPYQCVATAAFRVTSTYSLRATEHVRAGLVGDTQAMMFVMPDAALGVALPLAYAQYRLAYGFGVDLSASLTIGALVDGSAISRAGAGLSGGLYWGPPERAPRLLSVGMMLHAATGNHGDTPTASLYTGLNLSTLLDLAGGR